MKVKEEKRWGKSFSLDFLATYDRAYTRHSRMCERENFLIEENFDGKFLVVPLTFVILVQLPPGCVRLNDFHENCEKFRRFLRRKFLKIKKLVDSTQRSEEKLRKKILSWKFSCEKKNTFVRDRLMFGRMPNRVSVFTAGLQQKRKNF